MEENNLKILLALYIRLEFSSHRLIMRKEEIQDFFGLVGDSWKFFLQKCLLSSPLRFVRLCQNR